MSLFIMETEKKRKIFKSYYAISIKNTK